MANDDLDRMRHGILGDINPTPACHSPSPKEETGDDSEDDQSMAGGSRNYRQGTGATGGDIGNRPE